MREIKFRAWDKKCMSIHKVRRIDFLNGEIVCFGKKIIDCDFNLNSSETVLMQYTGLKDKNGKEIYEGDIIRIIGGEEYQGYRELNVQGIVKYEGASFSVVNSENIYYNLDLSPIDEIEIIGNIYENVELIKLNG